MPDTVTPTAPQRLRSVEAVLAENELGIYCVPRAAAHLPSAHQILNGRVWEPDTIRFITDHCGDRSIVHAGAFFGDMLPALSRALAPGRRVYTAEPNHQNAACVDWTIRMNGLKNVSFFRAAFGAQREITRIVVRNEDGSARGGQSYLLRGDAPTQLAAECLAQTLIVRIDGIVQGDDVGVIHLDVEGHEPFALAGAMKTIKRCLPIVIVETHHPALWAHSYLAQLGYTASPLKQLDGQNTIYMPGKRR